MMRADVSLLPFGRSGDQARDAGGSTGLVEQQGSSGAAAVGGILVPAIIYAALNFDDVTAIRGWAVPSATDIAFVLGVLSLSGNRVPTSLKVCLAALAIIDDLGAVLIIATFYTSTLNWSAVAAAACTVLNLFAMNAAKVKTLSPYLVLGIGLWFFVFASGIHATLAGVVLAMAIPLREKNGVSEANHNTSPLLRLEHVLQRPVASVVVPLFGFANAGVSLADVSLSTLTDPITVGVAAGLSLGKVIGVLTVVIMLTATGLAAFPEGANFRHMIGVAFLCGIGFTMSLFVGALAFADEALQDHGKIGTLLGIDRFRLLRLSSAGAPRIIRRVEAQRTDAVPSSSVGKASAKERVSLPGLHAFLPYGLATQSGSVKVKDHLDDALECRIAAGYARTAAPFVEDKA